jgi:hypothetical protein
MMDHAAAEGRVPETANQEIGVPGRADVAL